MANPNRVFANMSKNPWVLAFNSPSRAEAFTKAQELETQGNKVRVTSYRYGQRGNLSRSWNVWKVEA